MDSLTCRANLAGTAFCAITATDGRLTVRELERPSTNGTWLGDRLGDTDRITATPVTVPLPTVIHLGRTWSLTVG